MAAPLFLRHRVNQIAELRNLSKDWGTEVDLRASTARNGEVYLAHDPWQQGDNFEDWLDEFVSLGLKGPIALNTKEDGLEERILGLLAKKGIDSFFFVDTPLPTLVRWTTKKNVSNFSIRFSEFEPIEAVKKFQGKAQWVWLDCFNAIALEAGALKPLLGKFKICLVSPELQGGSAKDLSSFLPLFPLVDAVCTKEPAAWARAAKAIV